LVAEVRITQKAGGCFLHGEKKDKLAVEKILIFVLAYFKMHFVVS
jgi:hypothetical protein